ncbi:hypothetical protein PWG71_25485 [Nocardiopsis sp. N85]|nr:hypothetical protein [Nocardiopsis sp. N85]MDE3724753.1 hypothetical protein [Nocardiopsis sp. N85]
MNDRPSPPEPRMTDAAFHAATCSACKKGLACKTADMIGGR